MDDIGRLLKRNEILESILNPSKKIDPKFAAWTALTTEGKAYSGLLVSRSEKEVTLRTAKNENIVIAKADLEELVQQTISLMPDRLLNDLTDQQIADLLQFLTTRNSNK
jgi:putative heme-binding domain-containing protein